MKFAKQLAYNKASEWAEFYVDYDRLKTLMHQIADQDADLRDPDDRTWDDAIWHEVEKVNDHFGHTLETMEKRLEAVEDHWHPGGESPEAHPAKGASHQLPRIYLEQTLLEIMVTAQEITDFSSMNYTAFYKILKKYDKKVGGAKRMPMLQEIGQQPFHQGARIEVLKARVDQLNEKMGTDLEERFQDYHSRGGQQHAMLCFWLGFITMGLINTVVMYYIPATNSKFS